MSVTVRGVEELQRKLAKLAKRASEEAILAALEKGGAVLEKEMKGTTAWHDVTGELRKSIGTQKVGKGKKAEVRVGATAPHTHLLEKGTIKMSARPFIRPAWDARREEVLRVVTDELEKMSSPTGL